MSRFAKAAVIAVLGLEALLQLSGCGGRGTEHEQSPAIVTPTAMVASPTTAPAAPTAIASPTASPEQELLKQMHETLIQYYTAAKGQKHYDDNIYSDLLLTRYYIYDPVDDKMGIIVSVEGTITSIYRSDEQLLYFSVTPFRNESEANPYVEFVRRVLPEPKIDYNTAPHAQLIGAPLWPFEFTVPIGFVGEVLSQQPAELTDPFGITHSIVRLAVIGALSVGEHIDARSQSGQQLYFADPLLLALPIDRTVIFSAGSSDLLPKVPIYGASVMEQIILDTRRPENATLLKQIRADITDTFTPTPKNTLY